MSDAVMEKIRNRFLKAKKEQAERGKVERPAAGRSTYRLLPALKDGEVPYKETAIHFNLGADEKSREFCPEFTNGDACPVCEMVIALRKSPDSDEKALARKLSATRRFYFNAINRGSEMNGVRILETNETTWTQILSIFSDEDEPLDLTHASKGADIVIDKTGTGLKTKYDVKAKRGISPLGTKSQAAEWLSKCHDLDEFVQVKSYDDLSVILLGKEEDSEETEPDPEIVEVEEVEEEEVEEEEEDDDDPLAALPDESEDEEVEVNVKTGEVKAGSGKKETSADVRKRLAALRKKTKKSKA